MDSVMLDNATVDLETQIAKYRELSSRKNSLEERISRAEAERPSVKDRIFHRVLKGYEKDLENLNGELTPLEKELEAARSSLQNKVENIDIETAELQDKLDEISFRHRVGEFTDSQKTDKQAPIEAEYEELTQRGIEYVQTLEKLESIQIETAEVAEDTPPQDELEIAAEDELAAFDEDPIDNSQIDDPAAAEPTPECEHTPALPDEDAGTPPQVENELELKSPEGGEAFVDPKDWVGEFVDEDFLIAPADALEENSESDGDTEKSDAGEVLGFAALEMNDSGEKPNPLTELADPSDETEQTQVAADNQADDNTEEKENADSADTVQESSLGFPILSITKGAGSGRKLPLLPMTMTIGRELDNNIELKDQDVARYHARITYHAGEYVIQDLEGSSGTFVNDEKISNYTLSPGDTIRAGETELVFDME